MGALLHTRDSESKPLTCSARAYRYAQECASSYNPSTKKTPTKEQVALLASAKPKYEADYKAAYDSKTAPAYFEGALRLSLLTLRT